MTTISRTQWLAYAIASGACAALNGAFAKLTTTQLTTTWADGASQLFGFHDRQEVFEILFRAGFFAMNLLFNAIMWGLFTRALTLASSTVRVSVINTSTNFMVTAALGALVFSETLPGIWWLGATMLVTGSVIIGRREDSKETSSDLATSGEPALLSRDFDEDELDSPAERIDGIAESIEMDFRTAGSHVRLRSPQRH